MEYEGVYRIHHAAAKEEALGNTEMKVVNLLATLQMSVLTKIELILLMCKCCLILPQG